MADSSAKTQKNNGEAEPLIKVSSEEVTYLNRKLREAFKIQSSPRSAPEPQAAPLQTAAAPVAQKNTLAKKTPPVTDGLEDLKQENGTAGNRQSTAASGEQKKIEELKEQERLKKETKRAEEEKLRQLAALEAERQKERDAERQRQAEEEAKKLEEIRKQEEINRAEEKRLRDAERQAAQERLRQEKLRAQAEETKKQEEKLRQLAALEAERQKERDAERQQLAKEEAKKQEAARIANELQQKKERALAESLPGALNILVEKLRDKKTTLENQLTTFPGLKAPLERKREALEIKIGQIKASDLASAVLEENKIESQEAAEKARLNDKLSVQDEKLIEQKLWEMEDRRKEAEKKRWEIEDGINKILEEVKKIDSEINARNKEEEQIKQRISTAAAQEKLAGFVLEKGRMEQDMLASVKERDSIAPALQSAGGEKNLIAAKLQELSARETKENEKLSAIENREKQTDDSAEKRKAEQERWGVNETLKSIIKEKWEAKEQLKESETRIADMQTTIDSINKKIDRIQNTISGRETSLEKEGAQVRKIRNEISKAFLENDLRVNPDLLEDIIQLEDISPNPANGISASGTNQRPAESATPKTSAIPESANPNQNEEKEDLRQCIPATTTANQSAVKTDQIKPAEPPKPLEPETKEKPLPQTPPAGTQPTAPKSEEEKEPNVQKPVNKTPKTIAEADVPATAEPGQEIAPLKIKEEKPAPSEKSEKPAAEIKATRLNPETKLSDITKTAKPAAKTGAPATPGAAIPPSIYSEAVEMNPPMNIRSFSPEKIGENIDASKLSKKIEEEMKGEFSKNGISRERNLDSGKKDIDPGDPATNIWESRWDQIKKTSTPTTGTINTGDNGTPQQTPEIIAEKPNKNKTLVRVLVVLVLAGILGAVVFLILAKNGASPTGIKKDPNPVSNDQPKKIDDTQDPENSAKAEDQKITLAAISTETIYTEDAASVPNVLFPLLQKKFDAGGYYRYIIEVKRDNTTVGLRQFMNVFKINPPSNFYSSVSDEFNLFIYSSKGKNRLGFVAKVDDAASLAAAMAAWEGDMEKNTNELFKFLGRKTQTNTTPLKFIPELTAENIKYQSMTFAPSSDAFSIAYAIYNEKYFIFTTSNEALTKIFSQLPK